MADLLGEDPNLLDDLFAELKNWEEVLKSLSDSHEDKSDCGNDLPEDHPH